MEGPEKNVDDGTVFGSEDINKITNHKQGRSKLNKELKRMTYKTNFCALLLYLRGQDGWRHLIAKVGLGRDLGMGATSALCYAAATHHRVYILSRDDKEKVELFELECNIYLLDYMISSICDHFRKQA